MPELNWAVCCRVNELSIDESRVIEDYGAALHDMIVPYRTLVPFVHSITDRR